MKKVTLSIVSFLMWGIFMAGCNFGRGNKSRDASVSGNTAEEHSGLPTVEETTTDSIHILFPTAGKKLIKGESYTFKWAGGKDSVITIFLVDSSLQSQGVSVSLSDRIYGIKNSGSYEYTVPKSLKEGTYKIQIGQASSGYFKIISR